MKRAPKVFFDDQPIISIGQDKLGRKGFARELAARISGFRRQQSIVLAITGEWGSGKTSLKNMVSSFLSKGKNAVEVLEFSPWQYSGHSVLSESFFAELAKLLGRKSSVEYKKIAEKMIFYRRMLTLGSGAIKLVKGIVTAIHPDSGNYDYSGSLAAREMESALDDGAKAAMAKAAQCSSLSEFKKSLSEDMRSLSKPVVVVVDDIDRLTNDEIREVFQLIKSNADFPNMVYVLLFDREIVAGALDEITGNRGYLFLEKITQAIYPVPYPRLEKVYQVLSQGIEAILISTEERRAKWEENRWREVWSTGLKPYFENLRNVYRMLNTLEFHSCQLEDEGVLEYNPVDLLCLELIRLFEPTLYRELPRNRADLLGDIFNSPMAFHASEQEKSETRKAKISMLLENSIRKEASRVLLELLFPGFFQEDCSEVELQKGLRVGSSQFFDRYFSLSVPEDEVSVRKLRGLLNSVSSPVSFRKICHSLTASGEIAKVFQRLDAFHSDIPNGDFPGAVQSFSDVGDSLPVEEWVTAKYVEPLMISWRMIYFSLLKVKKPTDRYIFLRDGFSKSEGVKLVVYCAAKEQRRPEKNEDRFLISSEDANNLKSIALEKIRSAARGGRLRKIPSLAFVLWRWNDWGNESEVQGWVESEVNSPEDAMWFLKVIRGSMSSGNEVYRYVDLSEVARFIPVERIKQLTDAIDIRSLVGDDLYALRGFRFALKWREAGRSVSYRGELEEGGNPIASPI